MFALHFNTCAGQHCCFQWMEPSMTIQQAKNEGYLGLFCTNFCWIFDPWIVKVRNWSCTPLKLSKRPPGKMGNTFCEANCGMSLSWDKPCTKWCASWMMNFCRFFIGIDVCYWFCCTASATEPAVGRMLLLPCPISIWVGKLSNLKQKAKNCITKYWHFA